MAVPKHIRVARSVFRRVGRAYPLLSGYARLANSRLFVWAARDGSRVITRLRDGSQLLVDLNDYVGRTAFYFGDLDPKVSWICRSTLRPGDIMIDVGGNYGVIAMGAARLVGPTGHVHVFEPQLDLVELMRKSAALNQFNNLTVHPYGLSDCNRELELSFPVGNRGMATADPSRAHGLRVPATFKVGSECLHAVSDRRVRLMKIDVEGHESEVFVGASEWIATTKPEVIVFEHNTPNPPLWEAPGVGRLLAAEYRFYGIPKVRLAMRLERLAPGSATYPEYHDIVAVHPSTDWVPCT